MPVLRDVKLACDRADLLRSLGVDSRRPVRPGVMDAVDEVLRRESSFPLISPAIAYEVHQVLRVEAETFYMSDGAALTSRFLSRLFPEARSIAVAVATIGAATEEQASAYFRNGSQLKGLVTDALGTVAVEKLRQAAVEAIDELAHQHGLEASSALSPGDWDWPIEEQEQLFNLVPAADAGVSLTSAGVMWPLKSISMVAGIGVKMPRWSAMEHCQNCPSQSVCAYRHASVAGRVGGTCERTQR